MGYVKQVLAEMVWYFVGLDLGQSRDHSALAVVERADLVLDEIDHVTYARLMERRYRVRFLERVALGTPHPAVVERVREVVRAKPLVGRCTLVMDTAGIGARRSGERACRGGEGVEGFWWGERAFCNLPQTTLLTNHDAISFEHDLALIAAGAALSECAVIRPKQTSTG